MGAACCCLRFDYEDQTAPNSGMVQNCIILRCFQNIVHMHTSCFHTEEQHVLDSSSPEAKSLTPMGSLDNSLVDMFRPPPMPLPYDADPRYFRLQQDEHVSQGKKGLGHPHEVAEPFRMSEVDEQAVSLNNKSKWSQFICEEDSKEYNLKSSNEVSPIKQTDGYAHINTSSDDEDVCPTCLDEYTTENPKIITDCAHHFHLGCIYEWMERSDRCPVCGKAMAFKEAS